MGYRKIRDKNELYKYNKIYIKLFSENYERTIYSPYKLFDDHYEDEFCHYDLDTLFLNNEVYYNTKDLHLV